MEEWEARMRKATTDPRLPPTVRADFVSALACLDALRGPQQALLDWAVGRWRAEVQDRPLVNKSRRPLDDAWRQVIRFAGGDPDALVGPAHDALLAASGIGAA